MSSLEHSDDSDIGAETEQSINQKDDKQSTSPSKNIPSLDIDLLKGSDPITEVLMEEPQNAAAETTVSEDNASNHFHEDTIKNSLRSERDADELVLSANELLKSVGVLNASIDSIEDLRQSASTLFVLAFQNLFGVRLKGVVRQPLNRDHNVNNAQLVIDTLSHQVLGIELSHITGEAICDGDKAAISNLIDIFSEIRGIMMTRNQKVHRHSLRMKKSRSKSYSPGRKRRTTVKYSSRFSSGNEDIDHTTVRSNRTFGTSKRSTKGRRDSKASSSLRRPRSSKRTTMLLPQSKSAWHFDVPQLGPYEASREDLQPKSTRSVLNATSRRQSPEAEALNENLEREAFLWEKSEERNETLSATLSRESAPFVAMTRSQADSVRLADLRAQRAKLEYETLLQGRRDISKEQRSSLHYSGHKKGRSRSAVNVETLRKQRFREQLKRSAMSKLARERNKSEVEMRRLLRRAEKLERERIQRQEKNAKEIANRYLNQRKQQLHAMETFYKDRCAMLREQMEEERRLKAVRDVSERAMLDEIMRREVQSETERLQSIVNSILNVKNEWDGDRPSALSTLISQPQSIVHLKRKGRRIRKSAMSKGMKSGAVHRAIYRQLEEINARQINAWKKLHTFLAEDRDDDDNIPFKADDEDNVEDIASFIKQNVQIPHASELPKSAWTKESEVDTKRRLRSVQRKKSSSRKGSRKRHSDRHRVKLLEKTYGF